MVAGAQIFTLGKRILVMDCTSLLCEIESAEPKRRGPVCGQGHAITATTGSQLFNEVIRKRKATAQSIQARADLQLPNSFVRGGTGSVKLLAPT
jgi:hypothetical protein